MGNISFVSSKRNLDPEQVADDLDEINERRFGGFFNIFGGDGELDVGYFAGDVHQTLWYWSLQSRRKIGGKHPRPALSWVCWAWSVFQAELGVKWGGRLSDEGVEGTWSPAESLENYADLPTYLESFYGHMEEDDPRFKALLQMEIKSIEDTMPEGLYRYAFPDPVEEMKDYVRDTMASLGVEFKFEPDDDLTKYRRGKQLTMGELRALEDGVVVWLYIYYKESVRADSAFKVERRDGCWVFDDGSSFGADFDDSGRDEDLAQDEWSKVYEAIPDEHGAARSRLIAEMREIMDPENGAPTDDTVRRVNQIANELAKIDRKDR